MSYLTTRPTRAPAAGVLLTLAVILSACGGKSGGSGALSDDDGILSYVPADTPYVMANAEPIDEDVLEKMTGEMSMMMNMYASIIDEALAEKLEELPADSPERDEATRAANVAKQTLGLFSLDGMREAGFDINAGSAVYGHGILPVLRMSLLDADRFEATVAGFEEEAGEELARGELRGYSYRYLDVEKVKILFGAFDDYVVVSVAPLGFDDDELAQLVGLEKPANNIAAGGELAAVAREYDFTQHMIGFLDTRKLTSAILDGEPGVDELLFDEPGFAREDIDAVCRAEFMELADVMPRMTFGYREISTDGVDGAFILELREDIAEGLSALPAAVPGLGTDFGGMMSFGVSVQPQQFLDFYSARLDAARSDPYECGLLGELQQSIENGESMLGQQIPPKMYDFRGLVAILDNLDIDAMMAGIPPMDGDATVMLAIDDAPALLLMGAALSPDIQALNLEADGKARPLDVMQAQMLPSVPYIAMTDELLAVSTGSNAEQRVADAIGAKAGDDSLFMSFAMDADTYYGLMGKSVAMAEDDEMSDDARQALAEAMLSLADVYDRMSFDIRFTERGIEVDSDLTFEN